MALFRYEAEYTEVGESFLITLAIPDGWLHHHTEVYLDDVPNTGIVTITVNQPDGSDGDGRWEETDLVSEGGDGIPVGTLRIDQYFTAPATPGVTGFDIFYGPYGAASNPTPDVTVVSGDGPLVTATASPTEATVPAGGFPAGGFQAYSIEIENTGSSTQTFGWTLTADPQYASAASGTTNSLAPEATQTIGINFISGSTEDSFPATFFVYANNLLANDTATMMTHVQDYGIDLTATPTEADNPNHGTTSYTITFKNTGLNADTYDWSLAGTGYAIGAATTGTTASIAAGATLDLTLDYTPSGTGDVVGTVTATSVADGDKTDDVAVTTHVKEYDADLTPDVGLTDRDLQGESIVHTVTIENTGTETDTFDLTYTGTGTPVWSTEQVEDLASGGDTTFTLTFTETAGTYSGSVRATSETDVTKYDEISLTSEFQLAGVSIAPETSTLTGSKDADIVHTFTVTNAGNFEDIFDIAITGGDGTLSGATLTIGAGLTDTFTVTEPQTGALRDNVESTVSATSRADVTKSDTATADSSFKDYAVEITPADIEVSNLTVTPSSVQAGDDVTVTVDVENSGEESGSYTVEVELDGTVEDSETVT
ncbi:choice-of-anchor D domain-containing protein, partial [bacterium]|nr:choice-of-anchor D domain-containing protein [bacterium]